MLKSSQADYWSSLLLVHTTARFHARVHVRLVQSRAVRYRFSCNAGKREVVRTVAINGEPWFVTRDLCAILGIAKADSAMRGLEPSEKGAHTMSTPGGPQKLNSCNARSGGRREG